MHKLKRTKHNKKKIKKVFYKRNITLLAIKNRTNLKVSLSVKQLIRQSTRDYCELKCLKKTKNAVDRKKYE